MSDALLPYYNRELEALRRLAKEFADANPKIAGRLRLSPEGETDDPHVGRLLEGVSFLAARVHHRLDDEFPELTDALLELLYPHYLAPIPSCMVARLECSPDPQTPDTVPVGTEVETETMRGDTLRYRTTAPVTLWPVEVENVRLSGLPIVAPPNASAAGARSVLRITLRCKKPDMTFARLGVDRLRFFLPGLPSQTLPLYELLGGHVLSIAFSDTATDSNPVIVPARFVQPAGFGDDEALLPWSARAFSGFRLLTEYFAFPEKFLFVDIAGMDRKTMVSGGNRLEIFVYLDRAANELERTIGPQSLMLGCVPLVNLFHRPCEPIPVTHTATEYRVVPGARGLHAEVWSVQRVRESKPDGSSRPWRPFHRLTESDAEPEAAGGFYHVTRRPASSGVPGTEVFIAPYDPHLDPAASGNATFSVDALCLSRELPTELPGIGRLTLRLIDGAASVTAIVPVTPPTTTLRPPLRERGFWRLISHLSLGHLSVAGGQGGAEALKEVLRLYAFRETAETTTAIDALLSVTSHPGTARAPGPMSAFCRGLDVTLEFEPRSWQVGGLFLLASVLERFLALHASINSFTRTRAVLRGTPGHVGSWPARSGTRVLL
jgi:type VI secretion system protein ImpG